MGLHSEAGINRKFVEFAKLLNVYLNHFPRFEKYALSSRIRETAYEVYDLITEGQKRYHKKTTLSALDIAHEKLRMQLHLANELGYFEFSDGKRRNRDDWEEIAHGKNLQIPKGYREVHDVLSGRAGLQPAGA